MIDERPNTVKQLEEYADTAKWRTVTPHGDPGRVQAATEAGRSQFRATKPKKRELSDSESAESGSEAKQKRKRADSGDSTTDSKQRKSKQQSKRDGGAAEKSDGKSKVKGGLTNAVEVRRELAERRQREEELFSRDADAMGANAETVVRDRRTGKRIDRERVEAEKREKQEREEQEAAKYAKWSTGVKQTAMREAAALEYEAESAKPLTRFADDADREALLKSIIRHDDPMREFLATSSKSAASESKEKPRYKGSFPPNRFGIEPGYRWDGVDRSNGFEKRYFDSQANRVAIREENYRWATADL